MASQLDRVRNWSGGVPLDACDRGARPESVLHSGDPTYRLIVDTIPALIALITSEGQIEHVNRQMCTYLGRTLDELKKSGTADAVHPDDLSGVTGAWRSSVASGLPYEIEHRMRRADGVYRWFQVQSLPVRDENGSVVRWHVLMTDIDERKDSQARLQSSLKEIEGLKHENLRHERYLRLLTATTPHMLWSAAPDGRLDSVNQRMLDYVQLTDNEFFGGVRGKTIHPDHRPRMRAAWARSVALGEPFEFEFLARNAPSSSWRWCVSSGRPARDADGRIIKWFGSIVDLHDRKQAEETRLQAERQYRTVVETATDAVVTIDATTAIQLVNPAVTKIFGYEPSELIGKPLTMLMPARLARRYLTGLQQYVEASHRRLNSSGIEMIGRRKTGEEFPVEISLAEVINDGRRTFTGFIRDVTERKQAEELRAARSRLVAVRADVSSALATDTTLRGILQSCVEAVVKHLGAAFARVWVTTKDQRFLELHASAGMYTHLDGAHRLIPVGRLKIGLIAQERAPHLTNDVINDPRLSNRDWARVEGMVAFAGFPLLAGGQVVGVLAMFSREPISQAATETLGTISDTIAQGIQRQQAAEALLTAQSELAEVTRLTTMGELAASIAHEINQPLATVVTNAQACARLLRAPTPPWGDITSAVSDIVEAGKRASDVIARIRLLLRKGVSEPLELSVNDVIGDVIALTREITRPERVVLDTRLTRDLPRVLADRVQLQQVLINLITNATEAMCDIDDRPRALTISSSCNDESQVEVAVIDVGSGIAPHHRDRIFDPFFTTKTDGMGMGLAICRSIVEAWGGRLWATPNRAFGTTVRFALRAATAEGV